MKSLSTLVELLDTCSVLGPLSAMEVDSVTERSFDCQESTLFVAIEGQYADGHDYIEDAILRGSRAVICQRLPEKRIDGVLYIQCPDTHIALSIASNWLYGPHEGISLIAVTGTDGKSTTCYALYQLLRSWKTSVALSSTVYEDDGSGLKVSKSRMTTPTAPLLHSFLARARNNGCSICIIEASSHGLSKKTGRLYSLLFDLSIITTITSEHLDFHGTRERYIDDKLNCVRQLKNGGTLVITDELKINLEPLLRADIKVARCSCTDEASGYYVRPTSLDLPRPFILDLLLAATAVASLKIATFDQAKLRLSSLRLPLGRFSLIQIGSIRAIIDYAHTADAVQALLLDCRKRFPDRELIVVIGAAGRRDRSKRVLLGHSLSLADRLYLTDEDPRDEDPVRILDDIASGLDSGSPVSVCKIPDRQRAICRAIEHSSGDSILLLLGKGHEQSIEYDGFGIYWDELQALKAAVRTKDMLPVLLLYGGRSVEHEVSCSSAARVASELVECGFQVKMIGIDQTGSWYYQHSPPVAETVLPIDSEQKNRVQVDPGRGLVVQGELLQAGLILPMTHGTGGEDGTLQGILESLGLPYLGSDTIGSALCMDKLYTKRLLRAASIPVLPAISLSYASFLEQGFPEQEEYPLFIKPRRGGSSVGAGQANNSKEAHDRAVQAFRYDTDILIERALDALEIECAVFQGPEELFTSLPGSVTSEGEFYDYECKYTPGRQRIDIPAKIDSHLLSLIQEYSRRAFELLGCSGFARIDFFFDSACDQVYLNEVNTIPGMSPTSLFPLLISSSGFSTSFFYQQVISNALKRFEESQRLDRSYGRQ